MSDCKSPNLTDEQNDLCYEIKFTLIRAIIHMNHDTMWELMRKAMESGAQMVDPQESEG